MVEGEATQDPAAPEGEPASPAAEAVVEGPAPEAVAEDVEAAPVEARPALDWSHLRGFQTVEAPLEATAALPDYAEEQVKELQARAARFALSVDESIVLSSDGLIRWLGDPVARVVSGEALLKPHAVLLADEALAGEDRAKVETRVSLWVAAHMRKVLGPLLALSEGADLTGAGRAVGEKIAEALGVLERERVRSDIKSLDQTARAALRKHGVRFGSLYIYVPALLKPGPRGLCSLLWMLRRGAEAGADRLLAFAAAGRTSFSNEGLLSPDSYRIAGFRLCGERVVRVDIIERLSDLIRAAIPDSMRFGSRPASEAYGFLVTPQMTSLTGCSGEAFASILRSLGFEPAMVSKAAYEAAHAKAETTPIKPAAPAAAETVHAGGDDAEAAQEGAAEAVHEDAAEATHENMAAEASDDAPVQSEAEAASESFEAAQDAESPPAGVVADNAPEAQAEPETAAEAETAVSAAATAETDEPAELAPTEAATSEETPTETASQEPASQEPASEAAAEETVEIWRPAPRRPRAPHHRPSGPPREARPHHGKPRDERRHGRPPEAAKAEGETAAAPAPEPDRKPQRDERPRRFEGQGKGEGRPREDRRPGKDFGPRREARPAQIDPDSPFAKLAALKPLLERRDKRT